MLYLIEKIGRAPREQRHMKNELVVTYEGDHIRVIADGEKDYDFALRLWTDVREASIKHGCFKILGIANTTVPLSTADAYDHAEIFSQLSITAKYRIAWVELNSEAYDTMHFVETVLKNRGLQGHLFSDISQAKEWLLGDGA